MWELNYKESLVPKNEWLNWTELRRGRFSEAGYYVWDYNSKNGKNKGYSQSMESKLTLPSYIITNEEVNQYILVSFNNLNEN